MSLKIIDERHFERPLVPDGVKTVFFSGISGMGMGSLAGMFKVAGYDVSGSDTAFYPPMGDMLKELSIKLTKGFSEANLNPRPDLLVIGNSCIPTHPEARFARENGFVQLSMPEALARYFIKDRHSVVVAGTHGKTTTTALLSWVFEHAGKDPTYLVGGVLINTNSTFRVGKSNLFICEGDEYDTAYFDKRPKFIHYRPKTAIITSVEYDHADIYPNFDSYKKAFADFIALVPDDGAIIYYAGCPATGALVKSAKAKTISYGLKGADVTADSYLFDETGLHFDLIYKGKKQERLTVPIWGEHNLLNVLSVCAVAIAHKMNLSELSAGLLSFKGVKRRQEVVKSKSITLIDDFAHHPTAVKETIAAIRKRFPSRRLLAAFDPRSNTSRRKVFEDEYADALSFADLVVIMEPQKRVGLSADELFSAKETAQKISKKGITAFGEPEPDAMVARISGEWKDGDVVLIMSNGDFGGIIPRLAEKIQ